MKKFHINYCDKGNTSELHTADDLDAAIKFADEYVSDYEKIGEDVDPDTDNADIFSLQVWSYDEDKHDDWEQNDGDYDTEPVPELEYETAYYYNRF